MKYTLAFSVLASLFCLSLASSLFRNRRTADACIVPDSIICVGQGTCQREAYNATSYTYKCTCNDCYTGQNCFVKLYTDACKDAKEIDVQLETKARSAMSALAVGVSPEEVVTRLNRWNRDHSV